MNSCHCLIAASFHLALLNSSRSCLYRCSCPAPGILHRDQRLVLVVTHNLGRVPVFASFGTIICVADVRTTMLASTSIPPLHRSIPAVFVPGHQSHPDATSIAERGMSDAAFSRRVDDELLLNRPVYDTPDPLLPHPKSPAEEKGA